MNNLVCDLTHGGVKIAVSLAKKGKNVLAYDIYNTLNSIDKRMLQIYNVDLIQLEDLSEFKGDMNVIYPVHLPLSLDEITSYNPDLNYTFQTHHDVIGEILKDWGSEIPKIEVTGVKGKTTSVFMLKEILTDSNPLILSSLGAFLYENGKEIPLKKNISITPANIKETVDLAYKNANPVCKINDGNVEKYESAIFESSLGVSGIGDVGLLVNIVEDYSIAKGMKSASDAKKQVFKCGCVCIEKESLDKYYSDIKHEKINTFSLYDKNSNLYPVRINYSLERTEIMIEYSGVKTVNDNIISGNIAIETFAPGRHYVSNVLGAVLTALSLEIKTEKIISGLENFNGITGRCERKTIRNSTIIEEINPGLNTQAIKETINMLDDLDDYYICVGGDYGITCEEIDEDKLAGFLNTLDKEIFLTGDVGYSIKSKVNENCRYNMNIFYVYDLAVEHDKNLLFIYRSDYRKFSLR